MPTGAEDKSGRPRLAYLVSRYPTLSMIFVIREVVELRKLGFDIDVVSINDPDRAATALSDLERAEQALTHYVKAEGVTGALSAHLRCVLRHPAGYLRGWARVLRWAGPDLRRLFFQAMYFTEALMVGRWMQESAHTHLHVHLGNVAATVGAYVKHVFGSGLSITIHGPDEFYDSRGQLLREKVEAADFIVCISNFARSQMMLASDPAHWEKFAVCRLGVDLAAFPLRTEPAPSDAFRILCLGRLTPAKGQHVLLAAVHELKRRGRKLAVNVVGDGPDRASLEAQARRLQLQDCVTFVGAVNPDRVRSWYEQADVFVLPSFAEGIPVVLMESMAMGVPVVSTTVAGIPELIRSGTDGILVAPSDHMALADALDKLAQEPQLRQSLAAECRRRIAANYEIVRNVATLGECFRARLPGAAG